jgi:hypothetical protein
MPFLTSVAGFELVMKPSNNVAKMTVVWSQYDTVCMHL